MADACDRADERNEVELARGVAAARLGGAHLLGDTLCLQCGDMNDRADAGYGVCVSCAAEAGMSCAGCGDE